jgi:hypothetical protein
MLTLTFISLPLVFFARVTDSEHLLEAANQIAAVTVAFMWLKLLYFGRAFRAFGALIR